MARLKVDRGIVRRTTGQPTTPMRSEAAWSNHGLLRSPLDAAIEEARAPTTDELLTDAACLIGACQIALRGSEDAHRTSKSISNLVDAAAKIVRIRSLGGISKEDADKMSDEELREIIKNHLTE